MIHFYVAGSRVCAEMFAQHDGLRLGRGAFYLGSIDDLRHLRGVPLATVHIIEGWWVPRRSLHETGEFLARLRWESQIREFTWLERDERELFGPDFYRDCYPWQTQVPNVYRERREHHRKNTHGLPLGPNRIYNSEGHVILTPELHEYAMGVATERFIRMTGKMP